MKKPVSKNVKGTDERKATAKSLDGGFSSLADQSTKLASPIHSGKPATAEARQIMDSAGQIESLLETDGVPREIATTWQAGSSSFDKVKQAFGL